MADKVNNNENGEMITWYIKKYSTWLWRHHNTGTDEEILSVFHSWSDSKLLIADMRL